MFSLLFLHLTLAQASASTDGDAGLYLPPRLAHAEQPVYPSDDQAKGLEGDVVLRLTVDPSGNVTEAEVVASPDEAMGAAGRAAALLFKFEPAMNGDTPEASILGYTFHFRLTGLPPPSSEVGPAAPAVEPPAELPDYRTQVTTQAATSAASAESVYDQDLEQRIVRTPADLLHAVPGLFTAQHQGGGKADQYFLRGFDADHGTDIAVGFDGIPINLPSNGHGQGYTDIHFVLPETIERLEFSKGPYFADKGDFDTAGAVDFHTRRTFDDNQIQALYGQFDTYRVFGVATTGGGANSGWVAGEAYGTDGPFVNPEGLQRFSVIGKDSLRLSRSTEVSIEAVAYSSQWSASGLIPPRAIAEGLITEWGAIDPHEGGQTQREMVTVTLRHGLGSDEGFELSAYLAHFQMKLFNDFTFYLNDPVNGDLIEQNDDRLYLGLQARARKALHWGGMTFTSTLGGGGRYDATTVSLFHDDDQRQHLPTCNGAPLFCDDAEVGQSDLFLYAEENARLTPWFRAVLGVRADLFTWNVADQRPTPLPGAAPTTGVVSSSIANPKLALVFSPLEGLDLFIDGGGGFHSNDARAIIASGGAGALPRAWGAEVGSRLSLWNRLSVTAALWFLYLDQELTFDPDVDTTVPNPPSRRYGLDLSGKCDLYRHWLFADVDLMVAHVQYTTTADGSQTLAGLDIPLAPTQTLTAGLALELPGGFRTRLSLREIADHPANNDGSLVAQGYAILDLTAAYRWRFIEIAASIENLLNSNWREGQFDYVSRLPGEPAAGVEEVNFTPGAPFNVQGSVTLFF